MRGGKNDRDTKGWIQRKWSYLWQIAFIPSVNDARCAKRGTVRKKEKKEEEKQEEEKGEEEEEMGIWRFKGKIFSVGHHYNK